METVKRKDVVLHGDMVWEIEESYSGQCPMCKQVCSYTVIWHEIAPKGDMNEQLPYGQSPPGPLPFDCPDCFVECEQYPPSTTSLDRFYRVVPVGPELQELLDVVEKTRPELAGHERRGGWGCSSSV